jgi:hypothetical protein
MSLAVHAARVEAAWEAADEVKRRWEAGGEPDTTAALAEFPALAEHRSVAIDLAYAEYRLRQKAGAAPDPAAFAARFPALRSSIRDMLDAHDRHAARPGVFAEPPADWPAVGSKVEGLELHAELGRGSFGRAYLALDPGVDRLCVLKLTPGGTAEARVIGRLAHPHVTDLYWARPVGGRTAVCMPFLGVATLADVIAGAFHGGDRPPASGLAILAAAEADDLTGQADRRSRPVVRPADSYLVGACAVGAKVAAAVAYLHGEGVAHGDLKPSNVVVGPGGAPHLIDFNLSGGLTPTAARGTPAYMAPEVLEATRGAGPIDGGRADLFSLGVVLFELVTGRHPFRACGNGSLTDLAAAVRRGPPPLPQAVPKPVTRVIAACLSPDPAARPASAADAAATLQAFVDRWRGRARRRRERIIQAACGVLAVALGLGGFGRLPPGDPFERGKRALRAGDVPGARNDFLAAHRQSRDPRALAFAAYCFAIEGDSRAAAGMGRQAIDGGADAPEVFNIVGYGLTQAGENAAAEQVLGETLDRAKGMRAALYNRAVARYRANLGKNGRVADTRSAADIAAVLAAPGPRSADLHYDAARIFAACSAADPSLHDRAIKQLQAAAAAGRDPSSFASEPVFKANLAADSRFGEICSGSCGPPEKNPPRLRLDEPPY